MSPSPASSRRAGVLLHPSSLPGPFGIGDLGPSAHHFIDWLESAGMTLWQMLPLGPTGDHLSPYSSWSAFAGNPRLLSPEALVQDGLLNSGELSAAHTPAGPVDARALSQHKLPLLEQAADRLLNDRGKLAQQFSDFRASTPWLRDVALFSAVHNHLGGPWWQWDWSLRERDAASLRSVQRELKPSVDRAAAFQFMFARQFEKLREYAGKRNIQIVGDLPIYVAADSADAWAHREIFQLSDTGSPRQISGVPPDYFSELGQLWGNPLYDWEYLEKTGYLWWCARMRRAFELADAVRIDHFRGFSAYWACDAGAEDARGGQWLPGPGTALFQAMTDELGPMSIIAEDLGHIDEPVRELLDSVGYPGLRVLQFAFGSDADNVHLPHNHSEASVVYTGTHDNTTAAGWWSSIEEWERDRFRRYYGTDGHDAVWDLIRSALDSVGRWAIIPMQDLLDLGGEARMNTPGTVEGNWRWRMEEDAASKAIANRLNGLVELYGRGCRREP